VIRSRPHAVTHAVCLGVLCLLAGCTRAASPDGSSRPVPIPVATGNYPLYGYAADFSWVAGRVVQNFPCTYLRFSPGARAPFGGVLPIDVPAGDPRPPAGVFVVARGVLERYTLDVCGTPGYRVSSLEEH
jgi:hypothetical protein